MYRYHLDILALSEERWTGSGEKQLDDHSTILYSGTKAGMNKEFTQYDERNLKISLEMDSHFVACFTGRQAKPSVAVYYAPTNVK
ncbi:hypothetical protein QYM36_002252 [Artemia franciscana]|uniref:Uncharacterized protein n=1 Tax=Artemia franciscana TaxID=6661 RepID=A0AA88I4F6_ARTSF|nr:hypothetical protein QYM36_002252 [Artemia franciscana]